MAGSIRIKKGKDIKMVGSSEKTIIPYSSPDVVAVKPTDFVGIKPKMLLKEGAEVKAGTPLFHEKQNDKILFSSPVSGEVTEIVRGAKRKILEVRILADKETRFEEYGAADPKSLTKEQVTDKMLKAGVWPLLRQRPFSTVADPFGVPRDIYISGFDSAPLGPELDFLIKGQEKEFQAGIDALSRLTKGKVHLATSSQHNGHSVYSGVQGVEKTEFSGPHPSGNVSVQVHHTKALNKGEVIWYTYPQEVIIIGRLFLTGKYDARRRIALNGSMVEKPAYHEVIGGTSLKGILKGNLKEGHRRVISGNVLTGAKVSEEGFLGAFDTQVCVIPEGDHHKFLLTDGWLSPGLKRFSMSRSYPSWLMPGKKYDLDTNLNGEIRSFVVTGQLEQVFPFDIYPMQLIKSVMANDIDKMESMGIYEVDAEDFALCEVACTSKIDIQKVIRDGMESLRMELA
jgi:Na+-transporting NADH:ubiquinone oxidoreductase subunit A